MNVGKSLSQIVSPFRSFSSIPDRSLFTVKRRLPSGLSNG